MSTGRRVSTADEPGLAANLTEIVWMGGSTDRGTIAPPDLAAVSALS